MEALWHIANDVLCRSLKDSRHGREFCTRKGICRDYSNAFKTLPTKSRAVKTLPLSL
jgi:hypothetical protein